MSDLGVLLKRMRAGDESAFNEVVTALYDELHSMAARHLRGERTAHTLRTTALVHEAYLKLVNRQRRGFVDRAHFLAVASRAMRQVLVDYARARRTKKRSGDGAGNSTAVEWTADLAIEARASIDQTELLDLEAALDALGREDKILAQLIEMRYFGGMTAQESAEVLGQSVHIVRYDLRLAEAWLRRRLNE